MRAILIAAALFAAAPAFAQAPNLQGGAATTRAVLVDGASAPARTIIDGAIWTCEGAACAATGGTSQPAARACRRVVSRLGDVSEFVWKGTALTAEQLTACNA